jgi:hypothetical protein
MSQQVLSFLKVTRPTGERAAFAHLWNKETKPHGDYMTRPDVAEHNLRLLVVNGPGALTSLAQVLSSLGVALSSFRLEASQQHPDRAHVLICFTGDPRIHGLVLRKFQRLIDVVEIEGVT